MEKRLTFSYDKEGDILDVALGSPVKAVSEEIEDDFYVRRDAKNRVVGFMVLNFQRSSSGGKPRAVPVKGEFAVCH